MPVPYSILIIDDDSISREVMEMTLGMHGYAVATAEHGEAALALLKNAPKDEKEGPGAAVPDLAVPDLGIPDLGIPDLGIPDLGIPDLGIPDLVLMDSQMPGLSGIELIAALRNAGAGRIVAISASDPGEAIRAAADGFLLKPVGPEAVAALFSASVVLAVSAESATGTAKTADAVDPVTLAKFRAMMPASAVREIYAATAADMKTRLQALEAAVAEGDAREVSRIAHSIKGSCAMVGMTAAREAAAHLETDDLHGTWSAEVAQLHIALEALEVMLLSDFPA